MLGTRGDRDRTCFSPRMQRAGAPKAERSPPLPPGSGSGTGAPGVAAGRLAHRKADRFGREVCPGRQRTATTRTAVGVVVAGVLPRLHGQEDGVPSTGTVRQRRGGRISPRGTWMRSWTDTGPSPSSRRSRTHDGLGSRLVDAAPVKVPMDTVGRVSSAGPLPPRRTWSRTGRASRRTPSCGRRSRRVPRWRPKRRHAAPCRPCSCRCRRAPR